MDTSMQGRVVLITGTGGGQGRAAALAFAAEGALVVGCDVDADSHAETTRLVAEAGGVLTGAAPVDLSDADQAAAWVDAAQAEHGRIDVLYNNASASRFAPIAEMSSEDWRFTVGNELDLIFYTTRAAWPHLVAGGGGCIINTASVAGLRGSRETGLLAHAATKGAVISMTRQMAVEGGPQGIRAVSISPGAVETPGTAAFFADPQIRAALVSHNLIPRPGLPTDIVAMAVFLASDAAAWVTGCNIVVDGGMMAV
ncbi:MAG: meso-butanediol dehydrogenase / (S,S)-butanediol dehydrogenase / diacetyl reductase [Frankiaceae bacterium]|jgi:NAD(P)-dependent dehydrogenase (short-subunit alcohol dehydrogenase family)|nr:meso-butanediol dehydrogenase / (S,S)-butanediol dehydrogenase / diacetyl reductase [Frankiaceae bacterium]